LPGAAYKVIINTAPGLPPMTVHQKRNRRVLYGWFAQAGVMLVIFTMGGIFINSFGVFLPVISADLGWSRGTLAIALSIGILSFGLPSPLFGVLVARFGPRFTLIWGNLIGALGIAALFFIQEIWQVYALYLVIGLGGGFGGYIACATIINNWFVRRRSLAMGLFTACGGLGGFVFPPLATALIKAVGWRATWLVLGGIIVVIGVVLGAVVLVRNRPQDRGLEPGDAPLDFVVDDSLPLARPTVTSSGGNVELKDILKSRTVWLIAAFAAANAFTLGTMNAHQVAYLQDINFTPMLAATTVSIMSAMSVVGSVSLGALALRLNVKYLGLTGFVSQLVAVTILLTTRELGLIYVYAVFLGLGNGALIATMPTFVGVHFHGEHYAKALGIVLPFQVCTQAVGAFVGGAIYDAAQSYQPAFLVVVGFIVLGIIFISLARGPRRLSSRASA
jgi:MFS family permease